MSPLDRIEAISNERDDSDFGELCEIVDELTPLLRAWERASQAWDVATADPYKNAGTAQCKALYAAEQALLAALRGEESEPECSSCELRPGLMGVPSHDTECHEVRGSPGRRQP